MTVGTLPEKANRQVAFFTSVTFGPPPKKGFWYARADGTKAYRMEQVAVFRSGEFTDSMGFEHVYESIHMDMVATNFSLLHSTGAFPDPPVRADHPSLFSGSSLDKVIGYVDNITAREAVSPVDGETYKYIFVDYDVLDETAAEKIDKGLWRHRSAEIGWYETNSKAEFWPVLVGFAYVDIPAVEGLDGNFSKFANSLPGVGKVFSAVAGDEEEGLVADETKKGAGQEGTSSHSAPQVTTGNSITPVTFTSSIAPPSDQPTLHMFKIAGADTTDYQAVQAHIASLESSNSELEQFQRETVESGRLAFVDSLAAGPSPKIFASQSAGLKELVKTMTDDQFGKFTATYADVPGVPVLGQHFVSDQAGGTSTDEDKDPEIEKARRIYNRHQLSGMPAAQIAETPSGKLLKSKGII